MHGKGLMSVCEFDCYCEHMAPQTGEIDPFFTLLMRGPLWGRASAVKRGWGLGSACAIFLLFD